MICAKKFTVRDGFLKDAQINQIFTLSK